MAVKCLSCQKTKGKRICPALNGLICSVCCGTKRQKGIKCPDNCQYLETGLQNQMKKEITKRMKEVFPSEEYDVFKNGRVAIELATPFETYLSERFYADSSVNDDDIYDFLSKVYMFLTKEIPDLRIEKPFEKEIFEKLNLIFGASDLSDELKSKTILRILLSISNISGGIFGNRNYLKFITNQLASVYFGNDDGDIEEFWEIEDDDDIEDE